MAIFNCYVGSPEGMSALQVKLFHGWFIPPEGSARPWCLTGFVGSVGGAVVTVITVTKADHKNYPPGTN